MAEKDGNGKENKDKDKKEAAKDVKTDGKGFNLVLFFQSTREELAKVVWPGRQQLISESAAVLLMVVFSALLIYAVDGAFAWLAARIFVS